VIDFRCFVLILIFMKQQILKVYFITLEEQAKIREGISSKLMF